MQDKIFLFVTCLLLVLHAAYSHPVQPDTDVQAEAKKYAEIIPNKGSTDEECEVVDVDHAHEVEENEKKHAGLFPNTGSAEEECLVVDADYAYENTVGARPRQVVDDSYLWPDNTLHYAINPTNYTASQIAVIEEAIHRLQKYLSLNGKPCIEFKHRESESDYVSVRHASSGCNSILGHVGGAQKLQLADGCLYRVGTIMHEFLHALGVYHEQSRDDRDNFVDINWNNIEKGRERNFKRAISARLIDHYDYGSVMHYSAYAFAIDTKIRTIITKPRPVDIGQRVKPSPIDIERIQILYRCLQSADSVYFKHLVNVY